MSERVVITETREDGVGPGQGLCRRAQEGVVVRKMFRRLRRQAMGLWAGRKGMHPVQVWGLVRLSLGQSWKRSRSGGGGKC